MIMHSFLISRLDPTYATSPTQIRACLCVRPCVRSFAIHRVRHTMFSASSKIHARVLHIARARSLALRIRLAGIHRANVRASPMRVGRMRSAGPHTIAVKTITRTHSREIHYTPASHPAQQQQQKQQSTTTTPTAPPQKIHTHTHERRAPHRFSACHPLKTARACVLLRPLRRRHSVSVSVCLRVFLCAHFCVCCSCCSLQSFSALRIPPKPLIVACASVALLFSRIPKPTSS